jgi:hypothetical protein
MEQGADYTERKEGERLVRSHGMKEIKSHSMRRRFSSTNWGSVFSTWKVSKYAINFALFAAKMELTSTDFFGFATKSLNT